MTIARAQMYRQLYQMGGIGTLPMDYGQPLQVNNQSQMPAPNYSSAVNITANPLLNYGQTELNQSGGTPLTMKSGGMTRLGYQEGGMGIMGAMPQDSSMMQGEGSKEQTALLTIIQLLIEQGIPPEQARELAMQILQAYAQGGQPAVEEFANQLEKEEGMPENRTMAARGGIMGLYPRQGYFFKGVVKAVSGVVKGAVNAVKSVAKSPIGQIALAIAAPYAIGAMFPGFATLGGTGFLGSALRAGISNLAIQGITTGKINPKQALIAAVGGGIAGEIFPQGGAPTGGVTGAEQSLNTLSNVATPTEIFTGPQTTLTSGVTNAGSFPVRAAGDTFGSSTASEVYGPQGMPNVGPVTEAGKAYTNPTFTDRLSQFADTAKAGITNLFEDPMGTIQKAAGSAYDYAKANAVPLATGFGLGTAFRAPLPGEDPNEYNKLKAEHDAKVSGYITQYGGGAKVFSPGEYGLYAREKAIDPFAGMSSYRFAADGGRANFGLGGMFKQVASQVAQPVEGGSTSSGGFGGMGLMSKLIQQNPQMFANTSGNLQQRYRDLINTNFIDENRNGIDDRKEAAYGGRMGYAEGTSFEKQSLIKKGYGDMIKNMTESEILKLYDSVMGTFSRRFQAEGTMPMGEPRENSAGIMELDYRRKGGFVPPIGIKEKADDIPAMLSNNEFVFTANAVRNAGGGDVNKGAQRMYSLMKNLENGGRV